MIENKKQITMLPDIIAKPYRKKEDISICKNLYSPYYIMDGLKFVWLKVVL